mgnify:FL=1
MSKQNIDWSNLGFGYIKTDYRYVCRYKDGQWDEGGLETDANITLNECACVFQYCQACFEGMKAYYTKDGHIVCFRPDMNAKRMAEAAEHVKTGTVTYAVRDSEYNGVQIHKGDIIGMHNGKIEYCGNSVHDVVLDMMKAVVTDDAELITVYYGADTTKEDAEQVAAEIADQYPNCDVDCLLGGQPLYYYLISVE